MELAVRALALGYNGFAVVDGLNFDIPRGGYLCVVGENGSGKSTLIKGILGLISPMSGHIRLGEGIGRGGIGYLSQEMAVKKDFPAGVSEIVLSGNLGRAGLRPFYSRTERTEAEENMRRLGIWELREHCFRELSGGQQRRALLARALCASRGLLVLDEPAAGLDPLVTVDVYRLLEQLNRELDLTIIMVSHDIESALKYAHAVLHLKKPAGKTVNTQCFFGTVDEYIKSDTGREFRVHRSS